MVTSYKEACDIVFSAKKFGICLGLDRMELLLKELGHPERQVPAIHLAGTNGKGSTLTYLASMLSEAGYRVGTYTSPAILKINDKIKVNGIEISDEDFAQIVDELKPVIDNVTETNYGPPTEFELLTAIAFQYFATIAKPDILLIETGLGGRLDSTNVIHPLVSIITNIGHDHMDILGDTIDAVAIEKAGIIKEAAPIVSGCKQEEAIAVMKQRSTQLLTPVFQLGEDFICDSNGDEFSFQYGVWSLKNLQTGMLGRHQQENAALAIMALRCLQHFSVSEQAIRDGLQKAKIANRIEIIQTNPTIIYDGGHNPEGMAALANTLATKFSDKSIYILFCAMKDKDLKGMLEPIKKVAKEIILTSFPFDRVMNPREVLDAYPIENGKVSENWLEAYTTIQTQLRQEDVFVVTGSLYFLNYVRDHLEK